MSCRPVSPLLLERYELKYLIPMSMVEPISRFIEPYCEMDYYSQIAPDLFYTINSLYLDSPSHYIFRFRESANAFSFNMRVRSYGENAQPPIFFETKYKVREFVKKKRAKVETSQWDSILEYAEIPEHIDGTSRKNLEDFLFMRMTYNVEPAILTQYRRKAYLSLVDDYARVTFDRDLRFQEMRRWCLRSEEKNLCHYDNPDFFEEPGCNVILELKCEKKIPLWMVDLVRRFELRTSSFSKFANSMSTLYGVPEVTRPGSLFFQS